MDEKIESLGHILTEAADCETCMVLAYIYTVVASQPIEGGFYFVGRHFIRTSIVQKGSSHIEGIAVFGAGRGTAVYGHERFDTCSFGGHG